MLVIEGKQNKSRKLENWIRKEYMGGRLCILDSVHINGFSDNENIDHYLLDKSKTNKEIIDLFIKELDGLDKFDEYDWIAFYVNAPTDDLVLFQELDRRIIQNIIVTIQNNNRGITSLYYL